ncbi:hypothetical protein [Kineosporia sp. A_224]|uniref:hypothetical protein n=1 Tax=Kineosporia sp. A_224 TaxID=1962180 RepID=UPI000B4BF161|nr:hypothetical protein [Kineosporia sp. A_224]
MSATALALVLAAAVAHALWNRLVHGIEDRVAVLSVAGFAGAAVLSPALVLQPPVGGLAAGGGWPASVWGLALLSGVAEAVYCGLLAAAYRRGSLAVTYPVGRGTAPLLVTAGAWLLLGQAPAPAAVAGAVALAAGLVLVAGVARGLGEHASLGWAFGVGVAIATYSVMDAAAVRRLAAAAGDTTPLSAAGYLAVTLFLQGFFLAVALRSWARLRAALRTGALVGLGVVLAYLLVLLAFQRADAGRVATLREASVLLAVALTPGPRPRTVWVGAGLVALGAVLVAV